MCAKQAAYTLEIRPAAQRDIKRLKSNKLAQKSIAATIKKLRLNPRPNGVKNLGGTLHRVRDGEFRILYDIFDAQRRVEIDCVRDRKEAYKH